LVTTKRRPLRSRFRECAPTLGDHRLESGDFGSFGKVRSAVTQLIGRSVIGLQFEKTLEIAHRPSFAQSVG
jgi:hypothetical protein